MYCTPLARSGSDVSHWRLPRISSTQRNVSVRPGGGRPRPIAVWPSAAATASSVPHPLPSSFAPGSWTCAAMHDALVGLHRPGDLGDERSIRAVVERGLDVDLDLDRALLQPLAHPRGRAPARLEAERLRVGVVRHRLPTGRRRAGRANVKSAGSDGRMYGATPVEITPSAPRALTAFCHRRPASASPRTTAPFTSMFS